MYSALCLLVSTAILYFVLRYRIHIHIQYQSVSGTRPRRRAAQEGRAANPCPSPLNFGDTARKNDLVSALKHQGCSPAAANKAAARAMYHQDEQLAVALRRAIDYAREAA